MMWIDKFQNVWRITALFLLLIAIMGPWAFDNIYVPFQYPCDAPFIRLEGDFCGLPLTGINMLGIMAGAFMNILAEGRSDVSAVADRFGELLFSLSALFIIVPYLSTLLLIGSGRSRRRRVCPVVAWGLAACAGLVLGLITPSRPVQALWGIWLYIGATVSALVLETLMLVVERKPGQGLTSNA